MSSAHAAGLDVARLQSGDLSIYSALAEQLRRLDRRGIPYTLTPGVPAFAAAAAALQCELTVPEVAQSVVLTRVSGRASRMPEGEKLATFAASGATLVIHLAIHAIEQVVEELTPFYRRRMSGGRGGAGELRRSSASFAARFADIAAKVAEAGSSAPRSFLSAARSPRKISATARSTMRIIAAASAEAPRERVCRQITF